MMWIALTISCMSDFCFNGFASCQTKLPFTWDSPSPVGDLMWFSGADEVWCIEWCTLESRTLSNVEPLPWALVLQNKLTVWSCHKGDLLFPHISPKRIRPAVSISFGGSMKFAVRTRAPKPGSWLSCPHPLFPTGKIGWQFMKCHAWVLHIEQWLQWLAGGCWFFASKELIWSDTQNR